MHKSNGAPPFEVEDLRKTYRVGEVTVEALRGINLDVIEGRFVVIPGPSGSGKSTLLNIIGGIDTPTAGRVFFRGGRPVGLRRALAHPVPAQSRRLRIPVLQPHCELDCRGKRRDGHRNQRRADGAAESLALVGLGERRTHFPSQLSGGGQQHLKVIIAFDNSVLNLRPGARLDVRIVTAKRELENGARITTGPPGD